MSSRIADLTRRGDSLVARLTMWCAISSFGVAAVTVFLLDCRLEHILDAQLDRSLAEKVTIVRKLLREQPEDIHELKHEVEWEWALNQYAHLYLMIIDESTKKSVCQTPGMERYLQSADFSYVIGANEEPIISRNSRLPGGDSFRSMAARAHIGESSTTWLIHAVLDHTPEEEIVTQHRRQLFLILGWMLLLSVGIGYRVARSGLAPVENISRSVMGLEPETLSRRIALGGLPRELSLLGASFNDLLGRLETAFDRVRQFSSDLAHEFRTPLNNMRGALEVSLGNPRSNEEYREVIGSTLEECQRLESIVKSLLFLARADRPDATIQRDSVDMSRAIQVVHELYEPVADEKGIVLELDVASGTRVIGDRVLLEQAIGNLVRNAMDHTHSGGRISLVLHQNDGIRVTVRDNGSGIALDHLPHVFERFYRADPARSSHDGRLGLGLAITRSIVKLHGGDIMIRSAPGEGTQVDMNLPAAD